MNGVMIKAMTPSDGGFQLIFIHFIYLFIF